MKLRRMIDNSHMCMCALLTKVLRGHLLETDVWGSRGIVTVPRIVELV
jgi:hypothetical protein